MKTLEYVKTHFNEFEEDNFLDRRFTNRFLDFLPVEEWEDFGFEYTGDKANPPKPKEWTEENILRQLRRDAWFGHEKAIGERGISSSLMAMVVRAWCKVLELEELILSELDSGAYSILQFTAVAAHFGWDLDEEPEEA